MTQDLSPDEEELALARLDNDIRRLVGLYGRDAVRAAAAKLTKKRTGPSELKYWWRMPELLEEDAIKIMNSMGQIKFARDEYYINKIQEFYHPDYSDAVRAGISRHLKNKKWWTLMFAFENGRVGPHSHVRYREVLVALRALDKNAESAAHWDARLTHLDQLKSAYERRFGALPPDELSVTQIQEAQSGPPPAGTIDEPGPLTLLSGELQVTKQAAPDEFLAKKRPSRRRS